MPIFSRCRWSARCASRRTGWRPMSTRWWSAPHLNLPLSPGEPFPWRCAFGKEFQWRHYLRRNTMLQSACGEKPLTSRSQNSQLRTRLDGWAFPRANRDSGQTVSRQLAWCSHSLKAVSETRNSEAEENKTSKQKIQKIVPGRVTPSRVNSNRCRLHHPLAALARRTRRRARAVMRNAIYTWSCIQLQHSLTRYVRQYSIDYSLSSEFRVIGILVSALIITL